MLDKIPPFQRAGINGKSAVSNAEKYLSDKYASYIKPHSPGGSNDQSNIRCKNAKYNVARGGKLISKQEQLTFRARHSSNIERYFLTLLLLCITTYFS
ncbi:hypothetical protein [Nostoc sp. CCY0012]|uniref:hypothetical protein n=1 Tax=Nostoc sp. CCY0012 TaxID=1056123 RepID=UPI0039C5F16B